MGLVRFHRKLGLAASALIAALVLALPSLAAAAESKVFLPTDAEQTFVVPPGVTSVHAVAIGGRGGGGSTITTGGFGAVAIADLSVTPGQTLYVEVGGNGLGSGSEGTGGFNGGGLGGEDSGGGGGGATDIRTAPRSAGVSLFQRLIVAGGGGGGGGTSDPPRIGNGGNAGAVPSAGGDGDGGPGQPGSSFAGGKGAVGCGEGLVTDGQLGAGGPGNWSRGCLGSGGAGGGGGGGLYGGGGGGSSSSGGGGGAGSSGFGSGATNTSVTTDTTGLPSVLISYTAAAPAPLVLAPPVTTTPAPKCKVPNLAGRSLKGAKKALRGNHCKVGAVKGAKHGPREVVGQGKKKGKTFPAGTEISITLGSS